MIQTGYYLSLFGISYIYVRFRCARCKRVGEQLVREEHWDPAVLKTPGSEISERELRRFETMGPVSAEEVIDFHYALDDLPTEPEREQADLLPPRPLGQRR